MPEPNSIPPAEYEPGGDELILTHTRADSYHAHRNCNKIMKPEKHGEKDRAYIEWHDLPACPSCHEAVAFPSTDLTGDSRPE